MPYRCAASMLVLALFLSACASAPLPEFQSGINEPPESPAPWTHLDFRNDPMDFQFAIASDRCGAHRPGAFAAAVQKLNLLQPEFVMSIGDLIEGYTEDSDRIEEQWREFGEIIRPLQPPFIHVPGNHDLSNDALELEWKARFGPPYYHFIYGNVLFLVVDTEDPPLAQHVELRPDIGPEQVAYFRRVLAENPDVRWTMVFMHEPCWEGATKEPHAGWVEIEGELSKRDYTVFAGHWHHYTTYERHGYNYYVLATSGGGSELRGPAYGEFDHFVWVTMKDTGPVIGNILLDGVLGPDGGRGTAPALESAAAKLHCTAAPIWIETAGFRAASTALMLSNESGLPVKARIEFVQHASLRMEPGRIEVDLAPGARMDVPVTVAASKTLPAASLDPIMARITYTSDATSDERLDESMRVPLVPLLNVARRGTAVKVDGGLDDWRTLRFGGPEPAQIQFSRKNWQGPDDSSFRFDIAHDDDYVYVAVDVRDDDYVRLPNKEPWQQDGIEIRLDARPEPARSGGLGQNEFQDFLVISLCPDQDVDQAYHHDKLPAGVRAVSKKTVTGHITEAAIPVAYLDEKQGGHWQRLRLNIAIDDYDAAEAQPGLGTDGGAQIWWQPDWRSAENYAGSGTFRRK